MIWDKMYVFSLIYIYVAVCRFCALRCCINICFARLFSNYSTYVCLNIDILTYLLTAIGLSPGGSSTVHMYTQTIHRTTQNKQYIEQLNNFGRVRSVPRLGELYPGICLTAEGKAGKNLSQGSRV